MDTYSSREPQTNDSRGIPHLASRADGAVVAAFASFLRGVATRVRFGPRAGIRFVVGEAFWPIPLRKACFGRVCSFVSFRS